MRNRNRKSAMTALAKARPAVLDPTRFGGSRRQEADLDVILATARHEPDLQLEPQLELRLERESDLELEGERGGTRRTGARRTRAWGRPARIAMPVAAATAVAALVLADVGSPSVRPATHRVTTASDASQGQATGSTQNQNSADAVLLSMASVAQNQKQSTAGRYWREDTRTGLLALATSGSQHYLISQTDHVVISLGVVSGETGATVVDDGVTTGPATAHDTSIWHDAGSPKYVAVEEPSVPKNQDLPMPNSGTGPTATAPATYDGATLPPKAEQTVLLGAGLSSTTELGSGDDSVASIGTLDLGYASLQLLPTDANALHGYLEKIYEAVAKTHSPNPVLEARWMFSQAAGLITLPVPSGVRAAAYRLLAGLPGIENLGAAADPSGRSGIAVALNTAYTDPLGDVRDELIVDPQSDALLATEQVMVRPSAAAGQAGLKPGTVVDSTTVLSTGWSDEQVATPTSDG